MIKRKETYLDQRTKSQSWWRFDERKRRYRGMATGRIERRRSAVVESYVFRRREREDRRLSFRTSRRISGSKLSTGVIDDGRKDGREAARSRRGRNAARRRQAEAEDRGGGSRRRAVEIAGANVDRVVKRVVRRSVAVAGPAPAISRQYEFR